MSKNKNSLMLAEGSYRHLNDISKTSGYTSASGLPVTLETRKNHPAGSQQPCENAKMRCSENPFPRTGFSAKGEAILPILINCV
jgi:hypothetical protein